MLLGGALAGLYGLYNFAKWVDKPSKQPFADKTFPSTGSRLSSGSEK